MTEEHATPEPAAPATESAQPAETSDSGEPLLDALWKRVLEAWDEDKPHQALLEYALRAQKLPDVAGRYRAIKESDPEKATRAQKKIDGIVIAATQLLMATKSAPEQYKMSPTTTALLFAATLLFLAWLGHVVFHRR